MICEWWGLGQAIDNGGFASGEIGAVPGVQALLFDKTPQPLEQIETGCIRGQKTDFDVQTGGSSYNEGTLLVSDIVQEERDRHAHVKRCERAQEFTNRVSGEVAMGVQLLPTSAADEPR